MSCPISLFSFLTANIELFNRISWAYYSLVSCMNKIFSILIRLYCATCTPMIVQRFNFPNSLKITGQIGSQMPLVFTARYGFALAAISPRTPWMMWRADLPRRSKSIFWWATAFIYDVDVLCPTWGIAIVLYILRKTELFKSWDYWNEGQKNC